MSSVPAVATCYGSAGPPCDRLLLDPEAVLADRNQWPRHLCVSVVRQSTAAWAEQRALDVLGPDLPPEIDDWTKSTPLPVGWLSMPGALDHFAPPRVEPGLAILFGAQRASVSGPWFAARQPYDIRQAFHRLAVLPWGGKAVLILKPDIPFIEVVAFGIVDDSPLVTLESDRKLAWLPATMQFTTAGWQSERIHSFCTNAGRWWTWYGGNIQAHRPRGSYGWTLSQIEQALLRYMTETGDIPPGKERFIVWGTSIGGAPRTSPSPKTLQSRLNEGGITDWTTWATAVYMRNQGLS